METGSNLNLADTIFTYDKVLMHLDILIVLNQIELIIQFPSFPLLWNN